MICPFTFPLCLSRMGGSLRYYADADGLEVDAIIELTDGRWAAIEIKMGESKVEDAAANLIRVARKVAANPAARNPKPSFMAVLLGKGTMARRRRSRWNICYSDRYLGGHKSLWGGIFE